MNRNIILTKPLIQTKYDQKTGLQLTSSFTNGKAINFLYASVSDGSMSEEQLLQHASATLTLQCNLRGLPNYNVKSLNHATADINDNDYSPFVKYIPEQTLEKYIKKGSWQLGTINQYRTIENIKQRDEFEGYSLINLRINGLGFHAVVIGGYNYLIFCGTKSDNSDKHSNQFGEVKLKFNNVRSFADCVKKAIGARRYYIRQIEYNTLKSYSSTENVINPEIDVKEWQNSVELLNLLNKTLVYPSLFVKPESFKEENEIRIAFEMPKDCLTPLKFQNKELLSYISW